MNPAADGVVTPQADPLIHRAILPWRGTRGTGEPPRYGGWGGAQADRTPYDQELAIGGRRFDTGLGILANSRLEVRNQGFARFSASVGVDDSAADPDQARPITTKPATTNIARMTAARTQGSRQPVLTTCRRDRAV